MAAFSVVINAGGQSVRMGTDKALVLLAGKPMIEHVLARVNTLLPNEVLLITNRPDDHAHLGLPMFPDVLPGKGSLGGIYSGLVHSQHEDALLLACDMPFVNPDLLRFMLERRFEDNGPYDVIVPVKDAHPQGMHALYRKTCLDPIRARLEADRLKVIGFYDQVQVRYLAPAEYGPFDPQGLSFHNINTPDELAAAEALLGGGEAS